MQLRSLKSVLLEFEVRFWCRPDCGFEWVLIFGFDPRLKIRFDSSLKENIIIISDKIWYDENILKAIKAKMCDLKVYINKDFKIIVINIDEYYILVKNILLRSNCSCSLIKKMGRQTHTSSFFWGIHGTMQFLLYICTMRIGVLTTKWKTTPINVHNRCWLHQNHCSVEQLVDFNGA